MTGLNKWDAYYQAHTAEDLHWDQWLADYLPSQLPTSTVLELGCGFGNNALYLASLGYDVLATDASWNALERLRERGSSLAIQRVDLRDPLPFDDGSFGAVVADLCLHYFDDRTTRNSLKEIHRVLSPRGLFFSRVNTVFDVHHGAGKGIELEPHFYSAGGETKRFFDEASVREYYAEFSIESLKNKSIVRRQKEKNVFEIVCRKP